jgi:hypothetical protein
MAKTKISTFAFSDKGGASYEVISFDFSLSQNFDMSNKPAGKPMLNTINMVVKANNGVEFFDWMISPTGSKDCVIELRLTESESRTIKMKKAYCVSYSERFDNFSDSAYLFSVGIVAKELHVNDMPYKSQSET